MEQLFPRHPVFKEFQRKLAANHSLAGLLGLPEKDPSVDALSNAIHAGNMFRTENSFDPIAQNVIDPFTGRGMVIKTEIVDDKDMK